MVKWWKHWVTRLWLTSRIAKVRGQWRTLVDSHPTRWWGEADLSLQIHTQLRSLSNHTGKSFALAIFHSIAVLLFSHSRSLSFLFVIHSSRSVLLVEARQRDAGSADRSGQLAVCYWGFWSDGWASLACRCHKSKCPPQTHMHPPQTATLLPTCQHVHQHWHFATPAQFLPFLLVLLFSSSCGCSPQF